MFLATSNFAGMLTGNKQNAFDNVRVTIQLRDRLVYTHVPNHYCLKTMVSLKLKESTNLVVAAGCKHASIFIDCHSPYPIFVLRI
jgi:hypothetical protein